MINYSGQAIYTFTQAYDRCLLVLNFARQGIVTGDVTVSLASGYSITRTNLYIASTNNGVTSYARVIELVDVKSGDTIRVSGSPSYTQPASLVIYKYYVPYSGSQDKFLIVSEPTYLQGHWWGHYFLSSDGEGHYTTRWGQTSQSMNGTYIMGTWNSSVFTASEPCAIYNMSTNALVTTLQAGQTYTFPNNTYTIWAYIILPA